MRTLCLGEALVDLVCEHPAATVAEAASFVAHLGGPVATAAVAAARRGADVALAAGIGDDAWGAWLRTVLEAERVGGEALLADAGVATALAFVTVDAAGRATRVPYGAAPETALTRVAEALPAAVDGADAVFLTSTTMRGDAERALTLAARERALAAGKHVVLDPAIRPEDWRSAAAAATVVGPCVPGAFLVQCNAREAQALTGEGDPAAAAASLLAGGAQHVVITLGADGALLRGGGLDRDVRGVRATPVDRTGAGAAVTGVLLAGLARTGFYPAALAAMLPDAMEEGARATERYGALGAG
jgi:sugar/nucleoside kinase (ribokinase family)